MAPLLMIAGFITAIYPTIALGVWNGQSLLGTVMVLTGSMLWLWRLGNTYYEEEQ